MNDTELQASYDNGISQKVKKGENAIPPASNPVRDSYIFTGWQPDYKNVQSDLTCIAQYVKATKQYENPRYVAEVNQNTTLFKYS